jgi:phosphate-selective porin OprO and OprP
MKKTFLFIIVLALFGSMFAETASGSVGWDDRGYLVFKSDDGNFQMRLDTRFYINGSLFLDDPEDILSNQTNLRKARFAVKTRLWNDWSFEWDIDIAEAELVEVKDMWVSYSGFKNSHLKFGNFKQPLGLEELTSSRLLVFPERSLPMMAFETDRQFGLEYSRWGNIGKLPYNLRSSLFTQTLANESKADFEKKVHETGNGAAARFVVAPQFNSDLLLHAGAAVAYETPYDESETLEYKSEAETKNGDLEWFDSGKLKEVDHSLKIGLEGALQYKNLHLQGEYVQANVTRLEDSDKEDASFMGAYAYLAWLITGEKRSWEVAEGEFGQVIPKSNKLGAWELAARYSHLNLTDEDAGVFGGAGNIYTFGLNWYANPNVKFQLAFSMVDLDGNANSDGDFSFDAGYNAGIYKDNYADGYDFNYLQFMTIFFF